MRLNLELPRGLGTALDHMAGGDARPLETILTGHTAEDERSSG